MSHSFTFEIYQESEQLKAPPSPPPPPPPWNCAANNSGFYVSTLLQRYFFIAKTDDWKQTDKGFGKPKNPAMSGNR